MKNRIHELKKFEKHWSIQWSEVLCNSYVESNECLQADIDQSMATSVREHRKLCLKMKQQFRETRNKVMY